MIPMLVIGGWINWAFSGFLHHQRCPFPLTSPFQAHAASAAVSLWSVWTPAGSALLAGYIFSTSSACAASTRLVLGADK
uniref:Secreted protein n=1 Tax=Macrostomum lignano TaxID=282301 RepID=A0A1I8JR05_9PLAT